MARLGSSTTPSPRTPEYFADGRYLTSFSQQAILQQGVPAGQQLRQRQVVSLPLRFVPAEFARFRVEQLLRETAESEAVVQRQPGFRPIALRPAATRWYLSQVSDLHASPAFGTQELTFKGPFPSTSFTLHYLGQRIPAAAAGLHAQNFR
ncbi:hypothetical protein [Hymenobacter sp. CRA2]|uniref:hypothetical protein n=1 Tax=Hymenobacter sp. CRA2 TaxID=1955620 RepID=UPI001116218E|nr:hypothetical protein [Hymenobacter sp. CRA2]